MWNKDDVLSFAEFFKGREDTFAIQTQVLERPGVGESMPHDRNARTIPD